MKVGPVIGVMLSCQHQPEFERICSSQIWLVCAQLCMQPLVEQVVPSIMDVLRKHQSLACVSMCSRAGTNHACEH